MADSGAGSPISNAATPNPWTVSWEKSVFQDSQRPIVSLRYSTAVP